MRDAHRALQRRIARLLQRDLRRGSARRSRHSFHKNRRPRGVSGARNAGSQVRRSPQGGCTRSRADRLTALRWSGLYGTPAATDDALKRFDNSQGIMSQGIMSQGEPRD
jgi:hypothetical protein